MIENCIYCRITSAGEHESHCPLHPSKTKPQQFPSCGWICPVCGAGLSPFISICPCRSGPYKIICENPTTVS